MAKQKGITPIIAILVLLLITVAIAGAAWIYIMTYAGGMTAKAVEFFSVPECTSSGVTIQLKNIGTQEIDTTADIDVTRTVLGTGVCLNSTDDEPGPSSDISGVTKSPAKVGPGEVITITDSKCSSKSTATPQYQIFVAGKRTETYINC